MGALALVIDDMRVAIEKFAKDLRGSVGKRIRHTVQRKRGQAEMIKFCRG